MDELEHQMRCEVAVHVPFGELEQLALTPGSPAARCVNAADSPLLPFFPSVVILHYHMPPNHGKPNTAS